MTPSEVQKKRQQQLAELLRVSAPEPLTPREGDIRPFEIVSLRVERFRHAWLAPPIFGSSSMESPVHSERCTPGSARGVRKPTRGQPG